MIGLARLAGGFTIQGTAGYFLSFQHLSIFCLLYTSDAADE